MGGHFCGHSSGRAVHCAPHDAQRRPHRQTADIAGARQRCARGLAHIGVIRCLEARGYDVGYIAGTSVGALVGGIYAAGRLDTYESWARELTRRDMLRLLDFSFRRGAIIKGDKVIDAICELVGDANIEQLAVGFTAVATDMLDQSEVWLSRGSLFNAIRASTAIPTLISPLRINGRLLADGGLVNPLPIAPTLNHGGALIVAVDLNGPREGLATGEASTPDPETEPEPESSGKSGYARAIAEFVDKLTPSRDGSSGKDDEPGFLQMSTQTIEIMQNAIARLKLAAYRPDMVISVPRDVCQFWEFDRAAEMIDIGYERAERAIRNYQRSGAHPIAFSASSGKA
ncbi:MAG: patatin-like phospholipase family protein [Pseudomonadota bacterium]